MSSSGLPARSCSTCPGFVAANIHVSTDEARVINDAQRDTAEAFQAMLASPARAADHRQPSR
jgi:hypothetical protein